MNKSHSKRFKVKSAPEPTEIILEDGRGLEIKGHVTATFEGKKYKMPVWGANAPTSLRRTFDLMTHPRGDAVQRAEALINDFKKRPQS